MELDPFAGGEQIFIKDLQIESVEDTHLFDELKVPKEKPKVDDPVIKNNPKNKIFEKLVKDENKKMKPEQLNKMRNLKQKIRLYKQHFPNETTTIDISHLDNLTLDKLDSKYHECKMAVNSSNPSGLITLSYGAGVGIIESLSLFTPFELHGLSQATTQNEGIRKALIELEIEYNDFNAIESPEKKLAIATLQQMWLVHKYNSDKKFQTNVNKQFEQSSNNTKNIEQLEKDYIDI